ncbi:DUF1127 domain-containing protein [Lentilitoribacter sp. Alg239-R112]|jgi:uncharacterized protein YjiS (DUF1127 family)|uniref:DUF1127 domain-containing protein n=1 Tax=Lentilitoribacter sp. Alg239-R112 TaxID=2305987 RepID=UPI0013A6DEEE|nr:DUF1127 domain-containing protein [Lentilitoribacter sp. Alg239-R112]
MTVINCGNTCTLDQSIQMTETVKIPLLTKLWATLRRLAKAMENRRSVEKLYYASDHELADIGLRREDLYIIRRASIFEDPSYDLQARALKHGRILKMD